MMTTLADRRLARVRALADMGYMRSEISALTGINRRDVSELFDEIEAKRRSPNNGPPKPGQAFYGKI